MFVANKENCNYFVLAIYIESALWKYTNFVMIPTIADINFGNISRF